MYKIQTFNKIAACGLSRLPKENFEVFSEGENPDGIMLRSFNLNEVEIPKSVLAIARAGAGVNNIPVSQCAEAGVVVFNTPGANANGVKELVIAGLLMSARKIVDGVNWVQGLAGETGVAKLVEKGKGDFGGTEILGKKLGVIGLGAIGVLVANAAYALGMEVCGVDPFMTVDAAWKLSHGVQKAASVDAILAECDYISLHAPLNDKTKHMFNDEAFGKMKPGARIMNFARADLVDDDALKRAIDKGIVSVYVTDFPTENVLGNKNIVTIPHLGASTEESEDNCAVMAADELKDYLEYGNILNSVNYPDCFLPYVGKKRICVIHKNIPNVVGPLTTALAQKNINIDNMVNKSKGEYAYTIIDVDADASGVEADFLKVEGVIRVRFI